MPQTYGGVDHCIMVAFRVGRGLLVSHRSMKQRALIQQPAGPADRDGSEKEIAPSPGPCHPLPVCVFRESGLRGSWGPSAVWASGPYLTLQAPIVPPDDVVGMKDEVDNAEAPRPCPPPPPPSFLASGVFGVLRVVTMTLPFGSG